MRKIRSDNGGEYVSKEFEEYLKGEGVKHELTVPKNPEQNGVSERMNRTLVESVRSMLADSKLPKKFWAEALSTATYVRNRSPTKALKNGTPYEAWTGEKPNVSHFRVFGCAAYAHIPSDKHRKLDSKSRKSVFLGYGKEVKSYRLFDLQKSKVYLSQDVIFDESSRGLDKASEDNDGKRYVEIDNDISDLSFSSTSDTTAPDSRDMSGSIASDHPAVAQEGEMSSMEAEPILKEPVVNLTVTEHGLMS